MHNDITQLKHLGFNLLLKYYVKYLHQIDSSNLWSVDAVRCTAATNAQGNMQLTPGR